MEVTLPVLFVSGLTAVGVAMALAFWIRHVKLRRIVNKLPGSDGLPILGDSLRLKTDDLGFYNQVCDMCRTHFDKGISKFWAGPAPNIWVYRADTVEQLLSSTKHMRKNFFYKFLQSWLGDGLLVSEGPKWFSRRRLITPTFHFKILEQFVNVFNEQAAVLVSLLDQKAGGPGFDIQPYMYRLTLDIICETAMGVKIRAQLDTESKYVSAIYRKSSLQMHRTKYPWLWPEFIFRMTQSGREDTECLRILHGFTRKIIAERKAEYLARTKTTANDDKAPNGRDDGNVYTGGKRRRLAFIDMLMETSMSDPSSLPDEGIQEEVDTFMFEGHDTTAAGAVWILYMLACFPELQVKVQTEIDSVLGGDFENELTIENLNKLVYTECFIKETLRLYPPVPGFGRVTSEPCTIGGYSLPAGVPVAVLLVQLHRDPKYFPDPEKFDPGRWMNDTTSSRHPYCYLPFSAGLRNCIGQRFAMLEEKVIVSHVMRNFSVSMEGKREDLIPCASLILKPHKAMPLQFTKRF